MQHWWSGGNFEGYGLSRVRYYADNEAAVDLPFGLAHGLAPSDMDDNGPFSAGSLFGRTGAPLHSGMGGSGFFNTYSIPFGASINVTVTLHNVSGGSEYFWCILRGRTNVALSLPAGSGGVVPLPPTARLRSYETSVTNLSAYAYLPLLNSSAAAGAVLSVTLAVRSPSGYAFLEGELRAHGDASDDPWLLSSGTEDYFLGTFYFDKGEYMTPLAGLTQLCPQPQDGAPRPPSIGCTPSESGVVRFSAYRIHGSDDPLLFDAAPYAVTWRNGEPGHGGRAYAVNASSLALVYEW
jgi:hypothetical protein